MVSAEWQHLAAVGLRTAVLHHGIIRMVVLGSSKLMGGSTTPHGISRMVMLGGSKLLESCTMLWCQKNGDACGWQACR